MNIYGKNQTAEKTIEIPRLQRIWSHLLNKLLMENFIFYEVDITANLLLGRTNHDQEV